MENCGFLHFKIDLRNGIPTGIPKYNGLAYCDCVIESCQSYGWEFGGIVEGPPIGFLMIGSASYGSCWRRRKRGRWRRRRIEHEIRWGSGPSALSHHFSLWRENNVPNSSERQNELISPLRHQDLSCCSLCSILIALPPAQLQMFQHMLYTWQHHLGLPIVQILLFFFFSLSPYRYGDLLWIVSPLYW